MATGYGRGRLPESVSIMAVSGLQGRGGHCYSCTVTTLVIIALVSYKYWHMTYRLVTPLMRSLSPTWHSGTSARPSNRSRRDHNASLVVWLVPARIASHPLPNARAGSGRADTLEVTSMRPPACLPVCLPTYLPLLLKGADPSIRTMSHGDQHTYYTQLPKQGDTQYTDSCASIELSAWMV